MKAALNAHLALIKANIEKGEGYFDAILYYHGLLLMEISSMSQNPKKTLENGFHNEKL